MGYLEPSESQIGHLLSMDSSQGPIAMVNMLRYHEDADYNDHTNELPCSGREAYERYGSAVFPIIVELKGKPAWIASVEHVFIGPEDEIWHDIMVVQWPTLAAFQTLIRRPDYLAIAHHRKAALADSRLIITRSHLADFG